MSILQAIILAVVEGLTEFLPVSSTGHMIIASSVMGISSSPFVKAFTVAIQFGAILSVVVLYSDRFFKSFKFYLILLAGFLPAAVIGFLFNDFIDALLERVDVVGWMLVIGGIFFLFVDRLFASSSQQEVTVVKSVVIGFFQCLAMIPGVSRSASTIIGGLAQGLDRKTAAEFSFLLAVPTMAAATGYKLLKFFLDGNRFESSDYTALAIGNIVAFVVAWIAIRSFVSYLQQHGFKLFGIYRIVAGSVILLLYYLGVQMNML